MKTADVIRARYVARSAVGNGLVDVTAHLPYYGQRAAE
jgi:hypothetical protein